MMAGRIKSEVLNRSDRQVGATETPIVKDLNLTSAASYRIRVKGKLDSRWATWFEGFALMTVSNQTILSGTVADQAALHSLLNKIRDLGLPLISVNLVCTEVT